MTNFTFANNKKIKLGLVLSGGGAKGIAHIGVLKVLEEIGIKPNLITGTSMGSIVGGLYAAGYSAKELEDIFLNVNWNMILYDNFYRRQLLMQDKKSDGRFILKFRLKNGKLSLPSGINNGQRISALFSYLTWPIHHINNFNELPIPFKAIATDLTTGKRVVLEKGLLAQAMRSSMSIPSFFTPVPLNDKILIDGGMSENFPVDEALKMGADKVIGVYVGATLYKKKDFAGISTIINQMINYSLTASLKKQKNNCTIFIKPEFKNLTTMDYSKCKELIKIGEIAARKMIPQLLKLKKEIKIKSIKRPTNKISTKVNQKITINKIKFRGINKKISRKILNMLTIKPGKKIKVKTIKEQINTIYGSNLFTNVNFFLQPHGEKYDLVIVINGHSQYGLRIGARYDSDTKAAILINGYFDGFWGEFSRLEINSALGINPSFDATLLFDCKLIPIMQTGIKINIDSHSVFTYEHNNTTGELSFQRIQLSLFLQTLNFRDFSFKFFAEKQLNQIKSIISTVEINDWQDFFEIGTTLEIDTLDIADFPHSGISLLLQASLITPWLSLNPNHLDQPFLKLVNRLQFFIPLSSKITLEGKLIAGYINNNNAPYEYLFYFGGITFREASLFPFPGLRFMEIATQNAISGEFGMRFELIKNFHLSIFGASLNTKNSIDAILNQENWIVGYGVSIGIKTFISPLQLSIMKADNRDKITLNFEAGYRF